MSTDLQFDDMSRCSLSDQPLPPGGVLRALRDAAETAGLDPVAELYNEALRYANEGHLRLARERLDVLVALSPDDGEARLLLGKVFVAGQRWKEALSALDEAATNGQNVPSELRSAIEEHLRRQSESDEEQRSAAMAREQGEIKALRQEARRLRSENAQLIGTNHEMEQESKKWAWIAAGAAGFTVLFVLGSLIFGGSNADQVADFDANPVIIDDVSPPEVVAASVVDLRAPVIEDAGFASMNHPAETAAPEVFEAPAGNRGPAAELAQLFAQRAATQGIDSVEVTNGVAVLKGSVATHFDKKDAMTTAGSARGVTSVNANDLTINARTRGATHIVGKGDMLGGLAYQYYGDSSLANTILNANNGVLHGKSNLSIGMELDIPAID